MNAQNIHNGNTSPSSSASVYKSKFETICFNIISPSKWRKRWTKPDILERDHDDPKYNAIKT